MLESLPPTVERLFSDESAYRLVGTWELWKTLLDIDNSIRYGFSQYRLATPGKSISVEASKGHADWIELQWERECYGRNPSNQYSGAPPLGKLPIEAKVYLHQVIEEQKAARKPRMAESYYDDQF